ncbi:PLEKHA8 [Bugula neritina]|uniref:Pleckstrin homology domain-containing family A member 8 n=1 Tax=Bugula neritina TaxID=10212 RepID=A0A7J7JXZ6_BUGNE|nr:PLEKHA8 [Bugula neritina]
MEGLLWKWTNYWSGWQPRWFILDNGILSYYNSQDEVGQGCKGSIKMSVCDVNVDLGDPCRLDLVIAREQHFYIKASNAKERQQWLVALGSCKATLQTISDPANYRSEKDTKVVQSVAKQKKSELRIYCDLLMQQVHAMKEANSAEPVDVSKIEESSVLLSETCDTFIRSLDDCMKLLDDPPRSRHSSEREVTKPSSPVNLGMKHINLPLSSTSERNPPRSILRKPRRSHSQSSTGTDTDIESPSILSNAQRNSGVPVHNHTTAAVNPPELSNNTPASPLPDSNHTHADTAAASPTVIQTNDAATHDELSPETMNFFNTMGCSFVNMVGHLDDGVNTKDFTACSEELARIFDKLSATAFSPVKNDLLGNVKKIQQKWMTDPKGLSSLEKLVSYEIKNRQHLDPNSATQALLWLTRGLMFVSHIIGELPKQDSLVTAVSIAYERTLKPFHNFVVKGVVSIGMRALPYRKYLFHHLLKILLLTLQVISTLKIHYLMLSAFKQL